MIPIQFDVTPYTYTAVSLIIVGVASVIYLLQIQQKTTAAWIMILGLSAFTLSMFAMLAQGIVLWGLAFYPMVDGFSIISMVAMVEFSFRFPQNSPSRLSLIPRLVTWSAALAAVIFCLNFAVQVFAFHNFFVPVDEWYTALNPLTFLIAIAVAIYRTFSIQSARPHTPGEWLRAFITPAEPSANLMRNFSLALSIGMMQGLVGLGFFGLFPPNFGPIIINLSLLLMLVGVVYASFDLTDRQPGLVVRLVGLSLVTLLAVLGTVGLYNFYLRQEGIQDQYLAITENTRRILSTRSTEGIPSEVAYVFVTPIDSQNKPSAAGRFLLNRQADPSPAQLTEQFETIFPNAIWEYAIESTFSRANWDPFTIRWPFGDHAPGTLHQYAALTFDMDGVRYEVGYNLSALSQVILDESAGIIWGILLSTVFILFIFPILFRYILVLPLDHLLSGVRQADAGNLDVQVRITKNDEVGFLTAAFNKMILSLKQELLGRQNAENRLHQLNLTLEDRVTRRTRELEAMYDLSAVSSLVGDPQSLLSLLLDRSLNALHTPLGFILLAKGEPEACILSLAASSHLPGSWQSQLKALPASEGWAAAVLSLSEPLLITDTHTDPRTPAFMRRSHSLTLILAPLCAEGQTIGLLGMARPSEEKFDLDDVALSVSIVNQVGIVVRTEQLRQLVQQSRMLDERQRLARDLHDSVTQSLYGLVTLSELALMHVENKHPDESRQALEKIGQTTRQAIREMRLFIHQLRLPELEEEGLINALDLRLAAVEGRADVKAQLIADETIHLPLAVETVLYHIAQEALNNALKHAQARHVVVTLARHAAGIILEVADDGRGFDPQSGKPGGMGLHNMLIRAAEIDAKLDILSQPGGGARVIVTLEKIP